jgi:hypothetical protein
MGQGEALIRVSRLGDVRDLGNTPNGAVPPLSIAAEIAGWLNVVAVRRALA